MNELEESVARELLIRSGISVVWQAHIAAEAAYRVRKRASRGTAS